MSNDTTIVMHLKVPGVTPDDIQHTTFTPYLLVEEKAEKGLIELPVDSPLAGKDIYSHMIVGITFKSIEAKEKFEKARGKIQ